MSWSKLRDLRLKQGWDGLGLGWVDFGLGFRVDRKRRHRLNSLKINVMPSENFWHVTLSIHFSGGNSFQASLDTI